MSGALDDIQSPIGGGHLIVQVSGAGGVAIVVLSGDQQGGHLDSIGRGQPIETPELARRRECHQSVCLPLGGDDE
jgi:hypothetical protein